MILSRGVDLSVIPKVSDCFHLRSFVTADTVLTDDGVMGSLFSVEGVDVSLMDARLSESAHGSWQRAVQALDERCTLQVMTTRQRHADWRDGLGSDDHEDPMRVLRQHYQQLLHQVGLYQHHQYVFLWFKQVKQIKKQWFRQRGFGQQEAITASLESFSRLKQQFLCQMSSYGCRPLSLLEAPELVLQVMGLAVNGMTVSSYPARRKSSGEATLQGHGDLASLLAKHQVSISDQIVFSGVGQPQYAAILSLNHYPPATSLGCCHALDKTQLAVLKVDTFVPLSKEEARVRLSRTVSKYQTSEDKAVDHVAAIRSAEVAVAQDDISLGMHQQSVMLVASDSAVLTEAVDQLKAAYSDQGSSVIEESLGLPMAFWSLCPGGLRYLSRLVPITSSNFVDLNPLRSQPSGHVGYSGTLGQNTPLAYLRTRANTAYQFNCHALGGEQDLPLGHALLVGGSGSGKTVFLAWLSAQLRQYNGRLYYVDRDQSAYEYFHHMAALCLAIQPGSGLCLNPFSLPDSNEHRLFLQGWMSILCSDMSLTESDQRSIKASIDYVYEMLPEQERCLSAAVELLPVNFSAWSALEKWLAADEQRERGEYADFFSSEQDTLVTQDVMYLDITFLLDHRDSVLMRAVMSYLFYRMERNMGERLTSVVLDEAWAYLQDPFWCDRFKRWLPTLRKRHAHVVMATQSVHHVIQSSAASALLDNIATLICFKQPLASVPDYQEGLHLSDKELLVVQKELAPREVLVKQGKDSVIVQFDLSAMPHFLSLLQGKGSC